MSGRARPGARSWRTSRSRPWSVVHAFLRAPVRDSRRSCSGVSDEDPPWQRERALPPALSTGPSPWIVRFAPLVPAGARVLDLAAGGGRHARLFLARGHPVTALDRDVSALEDLRALPGC